MSIYVCDLERVNGRSVLDLSQWLKQETESNRATTLW